MIAEEPMPDGDVGKNAQNVEENARESEINLLNLIAEIIVEIIIKETENERDRLHPDKH